MKHQLITSTCALTGLLFACASHAQVQGEFVDLGSGVFSFEVTNNGTESYSGFDFGGIAGTGDGGFSGAFLQDIAFITPLNFSTDPDGTVSGFSETYFFGSTPTSVVNIVDTTTNLEGAYDFGTTVLAPGETLTVAVFSTSNNTAPTFIGGSASSQSVTTPIVVPEPGSLALLGLGGLLIARRRRSA